MVALAAAVSLAAADLTLRVTRSPHLDCDSPLKPKDMRIADFDKAGKAIMSILAEGG